MNANLVTLEDPIVVKSYEDIIDRDIKVILMREIPEFDKFSNALIGTKEHALFRQKKLFNRSPTSDVALMELLMNQKAAVIGRPVVAASFALACVASGMLPPDGRVYVSPDEHAQKFANVIILSSKWKGSKLHQLFSRRLINYFNWLTN